MGNICNNFSNDNQIEIQNKNIYISTPPYISSSKYHIDLSNILTSEPIPIINNMSSDNEYNPNYSSHNYSSPNYSSHNYSSPNYSSHNYSSHNYSSHNYSSPNYSSPNYSSPPNIIYNNNNNNNIISFLNELHFDCD